jgi:hypothetical protein
MQQYFDIGSTPSDEECAQVGTPDYYRRAKIECTAFKNQLRRHFGDEKRHGCLLVTRANPHDFGDYYEVVIFFNDKDPKSEVFALKVESETPSNWDDDAKKEIQQALEKL